MVTWIATSSFQYLEVRQSKASWPHLDKRSFLEVGNLNGVSLTSLGTPRCYSSLRYWHFSGHWQTFVLFQVWKDLFPAQLLGCSCLSLSEALTSLFPVYPTHPQGTQVGKTGKLCFWSPQQKTPLTHGNTRGLTTFWNKWKGKIQSKQNKYYQPNTGVWLATYKNFLAKGLWITLEE